MLELTEDGRKTLEKIIKNESCYFLDVSCKYCPLLWFKCGKKYGEEVESARELLAMIDKQKDGAQC